MPKITKTSPQLTCDICDFKATNGYIFKRHLHRCFSIHGIASKRSSSRNPIRLKGTEGLLSKDSTAINNTIHGSDQHDNCDGENELGQYQEEEREKEKPQASLLFSSQTSTAQLQASTEEQHVSMEAYESIAAKKSQHSVSGTPYSRHYNCTACSFGCKGARDYLLHQRHVHGRKMKIYACSVCDYASRYGNKVEKHLLIHSRTVVNADEHGHKAVVIELTSSMSEPVPKMSSSSTSGETAGLDVQELMVERPKVQPLKLKRLNIKMPFKVAGGSKLKSKSRFGTGRWNSSRPVTEMSHGSGSKDLGQLSKEVYKMVESDDGSYHYQCQDCLYYAPIPSSVAKHHALCHSRLLCCPHCSMTTTGQGILYEHLITHVGYGYIKCPDCSYVTSAKCNLEKHRSFHNGDFPVQCSVCSFGADTESKIKRHVATQHMPPNYVPMREESLAGPGEDNNLINGLFNEQLEQGNDNNNEATTEDLDIQFAESGVGKVLGVKDGEDTPTEYRCPRCPMVCYRRGNFTRHLTAKHKFTQSSAASLSKSIESQIFRGMKHKRNAPTFSGMKQMRMQAVENLKCSHCSYIAKWPSDLRRHIQVHTLVKRFKCSICTNKYKYLGDLNVHMRRDHNTEPPETVAREITTTDALTKASPAVFRCPICPFTTHSKAELEQHSRNHGNTEKTYQCRLCDYQTYWRGDVSRHLFRHHEIILSKEATEIGTYFLHRVDIKPITKQGAPSGGAGSLSPSPSPDTTKSGSTDSHSFPELVNDDTPGTSSSSFKRSGAGRPPVVREGSFVCEYPNCEFKTTVTDRMETHMAVHLNLKMFMCPTCGKRTNWKWDVVKHMNKVHMNAAAAIEDVITLGVDQAKASIQEYLNSREKKNKDLTVNYCSLCSFRSLEKNRVVRHMGTSHKNEHGKVISQSIFGSKECDASDLQDEIDVHGDEKGLSIDANMEELPALKFIEPPSDELARIEKPYACAICNKRGASKGDIKKHYNYTHPYKNVRIIYVGNGTEFNYYTGEIYQKSTRTDQSAEMPDMKSTPSPVSPTGKILRPDSKFSNPKMHGYVKPFKCSICGLRSNWKWDLKKHLRCKHPNEGGFVILLTIEEASETYGRDCTPSHPKNEDFLSILGTSSSPAPSLTSPDPSPVPLADHVFKPPPSIKSEVLNDSAGNDSRDEFTSLSAFLAQSPSPQPRHRKRERSTTIDPSRRQWKCSGCNYITNWRRNMARHIHRKHIGEEGKIRVVALHKGTSEAAKDELLKYLSQDNNKELTEADDISFNEEDQDSEKSQLDMKQWNCPQCAFSSSLRTHIILHMQQHEMKPFSCGICGMPFMNRGPLHRHLQKIHKRSDYLKLCKLNIKYNEEVEEEEPEADSDPDMYTNSYICRLCSTESVSRQEVTRHLAEVHDNLDSENNILKIQKYIGGSSKKRARFAKNDPQKLNKKYHHCTLCPFRSPKKAMLAFHMTYHKPSVINRYKCKHCPYYVSAVRLLHQHQRKWHKDVAGMIQWEQEGQTTPTVSPTKVSPPSVSPVGAPRRHSCEKCPYKTNSKNDFIYHKQFHRPKRTAEYKCEYCDYWVVHKRLLKQHMRLHTRAAGAAAAAAATEDISPAKSLYSDPGLVYDPVELSELAAIKQKMISAKITASLSKSPNISPMKLASQCSVDNKPGYVIKNGLYRKLHKCRYCPYTNIRSRNMQLHEMMHGPRESSHPLMKCPYCDYYVGSKGLLSHHMKVHQKSYGDTPENDAEFAELGEAVENDEESDQDILPQQKVDTLLQISRFKRFGCERCPYASAKRQHFVRHLELHGSRQRYTCQYCDYSVPSNNLLLQHTKLHLMPNQNLLASQSITNLQHLTEVPADVALASALPPADSDTTVTISVIHDHLGLYENSIYDPEPKKLYRCDRCPYANVRRDYLLSHLKFHMVPSALVCPYCDYSAPKQPLLTQHIRVHFCPLPELSDWLLENGQMDREDGQRNLDLAEALKVAHEFQNQSKKKDKSRAVPGSEKTVGKDEKPGGKENIQDNNTSQEPLTYICQYCDREFQASDKLVKHELQHLIGNHYEATLQALNTGQLAQYSHQQQEVLSESQHKDHEDIEIPIIIEDSPSCSTEPPSLAVPTDNKTEEMDISVQLDQDPDNMQECTDSCNVGTVNNVSDTSLCDNTADETSEGNGSVANLVVTSGGKEHCYHNAGVIVESAEDGGDEGVAGEMRCGSSGVSEVGRKCKSTYEYLKELGEACKISSERVKASEDAGNIETEGEENRTEEGDKENRNIGTEEEDKENRTEEKDQENRNIGMEEENRENRNIGNEGGVIEIRTGKEVGETGSEGGVIETRNIGTERGVTETSNSAIEGEINNIETKKGIKETDMMVADEEINRTETEKLTQSSNTETEKEMRETCNAETEKEMSNTKTEKEISNAETEKEMSNAETENEMSNAETEKEMRETCNTETEKEMRETCNTETEKEISNTETENEMSNAETENEVSAETEKEISNTETEKEMSNAETENEVSAETEKEMSNAETEKEMSNAETEKDINNTKSSVENGEVRKEIDSIDAVGEISDGEMVAADGATSENCGEGREKDAKMDFNMEIPTGDTQCLRLDGGEKDCDEMNEDGKMEGERSAASASSEDMECDKEPTEDSVNTESDICDVVEKSEEPTEDSMNTESDICDVVEKSGHEDAFDGESGGLSTSSDALQAKM